MSNRKSKAEVLVVQLVAHDPEPLRPLGDHRRAAVVESARLPLCSFEEALQWAARFNRGEIRHPMGAWAVVKRVRVREEMGHGMPVTSTATS